MVQTLQGLLLPRRCSHFYSQELDSWVLYIRVLISSCMLAIIFMVEAWAGKLERKAVLCLSIVR